MNGPFIPKGYWFSQDGVIQHWLLETGEISEDTEVHLQVFDVSCPSGEYIVDPGKLR